MVELPPAAVTNRMHWSRWAVATDLDFSEVSRHQVAVPILWSLMTMIAPNMSNAQGLCFAPLRDLSTVSEIQCFPPPLLLLYYNFPDTYTRKIRSTRLQDKSDTMCVRKADHCQAVQGPGGGYDAGQAGYLMSSTDSNHSAPSAGPIPPLSGSIVHGGTST